MSKLGKFLNYVVSMYVLIPDCRDKFSDWHFGDYYVDSDPRTSGGARDRTSNRLSVDEKWLF